MVSTKTKELLLLELSDGKLTEYLYHPTQYLARNARKSAFLRHLKSTVQDLKLKLESRIYDSPDHLIYIHIGKCGGASLWSALKKSRIINKEFSRISKVHISKPPIARKSRYIIVVRNPISRALSAFNWRYKLVVESEVQKDRFPNEYCVLNKYKNLNNISEALYKGGSLRLDVASEFRSIHHLNEDISFYLSSLLDKLEKTQIFGVLATECLDVDIERVLGVTQVEKVHKNAHRKESENMKLSAVAQDSLKRFLAADYEAITRLSELYEFEEQLLDQLRK